MLSCGESCWVFFSSTSLSLESTIYIALASFVFYTTTMGWWPDNRHPLNGSHSFDITLTCEISLFLQILKTFNAPRWQMEIVHDIFADTTREDRKNLPKFFFFCENKEMNNNNNNKRKMRNGKRWCGSVVNSAPMTTNSERMLASPRWRQTAMFFCHAWFDFPLFVLFLSVAMAQ